MTAIFRLLVSDLMRLWKQGVAIVGLMVCGVATFIMSTSTIRSLEMSRDLYYARYRFSHLWAPLVRAPEGLLEHIRAIPGLEEASGKIVRQVLLDFPSMPEPASAKLISIDRDPNLGINGLFLRRGRFPEYSQETEVVISELFAEAQGLGIGDKIVANLGGKRETLHIVGIGLSPDSIYVVQPGLILSDNRLYGILWVPRAKLAAAFNMEGAFNEVNARVSRNGNIRRVQEELDRLLKPYGGTGAYDREDQESHGRVRDEMKELRTMAFLAPAIFLSVSAFLLNMVFSRMVAHQTEQIATMRAFGYRRWEIGWHYLRLVSVWMTIGLLLGIVVGLQLASWLNELYKLFFRFPEIVAVRFGWEWILAVALCVSVASLGTLSGIHRAMQLPPAEAMRAGTTTVSPPGWVRDLRWINLLPSFNRLVAIRLVSNPWLSLFSILGMALGISLLVLSSFMESTIDYVLEHQFSKSQRHSLQLAFYEKRSESCLHSIEQWTGVQRVEGFRSVPARLHHGLQNERLALLGLEPHSQLFRVLDHNDQPIHFTEQSGLTLNQKLANKLGVGLGETVEIDILEGQERSIALPVARIIANYTGPAAYLPRSQLHRLMMEGEQVSGVFLTLDTSYRDPIYRMIKDTPGISGILDKRAALANFRALLSKSTGWMRIVNGVFAALIALGVAYNSTLITFTERARDLATMRVLGYNNAEVKWILLLELVCITLLALPIGIPLGYTFAYGMTVALDSDSHRFPLIIDRQTIAYAISVTLGSSLLCGWLVIRMIEGMDLISVLKVRE